MLKGKITRISNKDAIKQHIDKLIQDKELLSKQQRDMSVQDIVKRIILKTENNEFEINFEEATIWVELDGDKGVHYFHVAAKLLEHKLELLEWKLSPHSAWFLLRPLTNQIQLDMALEAVNKQAHRYHLHIYKQPEAEVYYVDINKEDK